MAALSTGEVQDAGRFLPRRHDQPFGRAATGGLDARHVQIAGQR